MGPGLKGLTKRPKLANDAAMSDENLGKFLNEGGNGMPGFADGLTKAEKADVIAYLHDLAPASTSSGTSTSNHAQFGIAAATWTSPRSRSAVAVTRRGNPPGPWRNRANGGRADPAEGR